jgi:predicted dinucleotide-binding enzyme
MKIAIIGTGTMAKALLQTFYKVYPNDLMLAGRDLSRTLNVIKEIAPKALALTMEEAVKAADIIIPTLWFADIIPWIQLNKVLLRGKILIDITNPFNDQYDDFTISHDTSSAEEIQKLIPETKVVGAFKNTYWVVFEQPILQGLKSDIYVTSDNEEALLTVMNLLKSLPFRILKAGKLKNNRTIERMTLLAREISINAGNYPRIAFNLWGLEHEIE